MLIREEEDELVSIDLLDVDIVPPMGIATGDMSGICFVRVQLRSTTLARVQEEIALVHLKQPHTKTHRRMKAAESKLTAHCPSPLELEECP